MPRIIRIFSWILLLAAFLAATSGFTAFRHRCGASGKTETALFPGLFKSRVGCCNVLMSSSASSCRHERHGLKGIGQPDCCKISRLFVKVTSSFLPESKLPVKSLANLHSNDSHVATDVTSQLATVCDYYLHGYQPPPPPGKTLLLQFHQIKIPLPFSA